MLLQPDGAVGGQGVLCSAEYGSFNGGGGAPVENEGRRVTQDRKVFGRLGGVRDQAAGKVACLGDGGLPECLVGPRARGGAGRYRRGEGLWSEGGGTPTEWSSTPSA